jgi:ribose/xylose/arabinose/galactoside ABC-type transport system permease subunit
LAAIARVFFRAFPSTSPYKELIKQIALFCCAGLLVALLMLTYGLDLSPGFF